MTMKNILALVLCILLFSASRAVSDDLTPSGNLTGIDKVHEKIAVSFNLKGAEEFRLDPEEIKKILRNALGSVGVVTNGSGLGVPMVGASVVGESTGGGGARYIVEVFVRATIRSPFAKNRSVEAIFWRDIASGEETMRYDPASKDLVKPRGPISERVYSSVRDVASHLASELKKANPSK